MRGDIMNIVHPSHVAKKLTTFCNHMSHAAFYIVSGAEVNSIPRKRSRLDHAAEFKVCRSSQECVHGKFWVIEKDVKPRCNHFGLVSFTRMPALIQCYFGLQLLFILWQPNAPEYLPLQALQTKTFLENQDPIGPSVEWPKNYSGLFRDLA